MKLLICFLLFAAHVCKAQDTNQPITFRHITSGGFNAGGHLLGGTVFCATNHTTNIFDIWLSAIEVKTGTNWTVQARPMQCLLIQEPGKPAGSFYLNPHGSGYVTPKLPPQPNGTTWRARARVRPVLSGSEAAMARVRGTPSRLLTRFRTGDTNIPVDPFSTSIHVFGKGTEVLSQEILHE